MTQFVLAFYELDRRYGGPEEGGWYYTCGELRRTTRKTYATEAEADAAAARANDLLQHLQRRKRSIGSVLYGGGRHTARPHLGAPPERFPATRPHYE